jgi:hypothetical protein
MSLDPSIPQEAFQGLVEEEFFGKRDTYETQLVRGLVLLLKSVEIKKCKEMDLGTEPDDWDIINIESGGMCGDENGEESDD